MILQHASGSPTEVPGPQFVHHLRQQQQQKNLSYDMEAARVDVSRRASDL